MADALAETWPGHTFRAAVDTAPVLEREHAQRAGLGWVGKHTLLIHPQLGSWLLLGEIVTTLPLKTSAQAGRGPMSDHCGTCTRCIDACPTDCITPYQLDAKRCISYLTLEHRGLIDQSLQTRMGEWVAGCDICQEVCPHNRPRDDAPAAQLDAYAPRDYATGLPLLELLGWTAEDRQRVFTRSALKRMKLDQVRRNAIIAAGNWLATHDSPALRAKLRTIAADADESEVVRVTAQQVVARLAAKT
jgi:epoxyqueuosine reductase